MKEKTKIKAEIVADSIDSRGNRLISVLAVMPRIIIAEINTHRMLSKNTSSSRAIPFKKMVESVQNDPFVPIAWQKHHSGMQGNEYITDKIEIENCKYLWLIARDHAVEDAMRLNSVSKVTKQLCNRLLEPFMWTTMLITGSKEGWQNFFNLRCPSYNLGDGIIHKSRKDALKYIMDNNLDRFEGLFITETDWLLANKGQAEVHLMDLAEKIYDAMNESTPRQLKVGEYHIPMIEVIED